jgi:hypothetical protein
MDEEEVLLKISVPVNLRLKLKIEATTMSITLTKLVNEILERHIENGKLVQQ